MVVKLQEASQCKPSFAARRRGTARTVSVASFWFSVHNSLSKRPRLLRITLVVAGVLIGLTGFELRTSWFQSRLLAAIARRMTFRMGQGPSAAIRYPQAGPYDKRLGYAQLPGFLERLQAAAYEVEAQARGSEVLLNLTDRGVFPIYPEKTVAGLRVLDRDGKLLREARYPERTYSDFESSPPLVVETLLFMENRELLDPGLMYRNPAVEWDRLTYAAIGLGIHKINPRHQIIGGSTLATQLEKVRHSPGGFTGSVWQKFRQMASASLRAYQSGERTLEAQKRIIRAYINSIPLAGIPGYGEVTGLGDGLWAWFGADFESVNRLLWAEETALPVPLQRERARAYRQVLSLLIALKRPSEYLRKDWKRLETQVDRYLPLLSEQRVISRLLRDGALQVRDEPALRAPARTPVSFVERKTTNGVQASLLSQLGLDHVYDLNRLDLTVTTTLDKDVGEDVTRTLQRLQDRSYAAQAGLRGYQLLDRGDPKGVVYSFTLYERGPGVNVLRVQADNYNQPLNINEGTKLELGSTAKLRTLVNYLEIVALLHKQYAGMTTEELKSVRPAPGDHLTRWALGYLVTAQDPQLPAMLEATMNRRYSANPGEAFFTGSGLHRFKNFDAKDNNRVMTVRKALQRSVNLVFIRLMRDIVNYYMFRVPGSSPAILKDKDHPQRRPYLVRFADREGRTFLSRFYRRYRNQTPDQILRTLLQGARVTPKRLAVIYRSVRPGEGLKEFETFLRSQLPDEKLSPGKVEDLYTKYRVDAFSLADRGWLAGVHPLELWLAGYLGRHPEASLNGVFQAGRKERQQAYVWLFKTRHKRAQDKRIRILLEADAFQEIHRAWKRQGYPFPSLVPSYATAIGSSGDRPAALAELLGIILNAGVSYPGIRVRRLHFAKGTPTETVLTRGQGTGVRVFPAALADLVRKELIGVVAHGTGRRAFGTVVLSDGTPVDVGGKTGTGDNRFETHGSDGRIHSRVVNRTATFTFLIGDRFFGTITAYVPGREAGAYRFTSALPVQVFKHLVPILLPLLERPAELIRYRSSPDSFVAVSR